MDEEEIRRKTAVLLARVEDVSEHDFEKMVALARSIEMDDIPRLPDLLARDKWLEGFWIRAKRVGATIAVLLSALYMAWDAIKEFILRMAQP